MPKFSPIDISGKPSYLHLDTLITKDSELSPAASNGEGWIPALEHGCDFPEEIFLRVMHNLISNPNVNSSLLLRADILYDSGEQDEETEGHEKEEDCGTCRCGNPALSQELRANLKVEKLDTGEEPLPEPWTLPINGFSVHRTIVRRFVPRNPQVDKYMLQTCLFLRQTGNEDGGALEGDIGIEPKSPKQSMIIYLPHAKSPSEIPFYHPPIKAIAFLHSCSMPTTDTPTAAPSPQSPSFTVSIHHLSFPTPATPSSSKLPPTANPNRLPRTLHHLLHTLIKHGQGLLSGYVKRVHHDLLIPQAPLQDTYLRLKSFHAKRLIDNWVENTDPRKHVFEDLLIAAFLIELWKGMYLPPAGAGTKAIETLNPSSNSPLPPFPGFVDIGCGNGVLVDILRREGYLGWGFDARRRKTWNVLLMSPDSPTIPTTPSYPHSPNPPPSPWLLPLLLLPSIIPQSSSSSSSTSTSDSIPEATPIHNGHFPLNTFLISNHSDQLTGWTPLLSRLCNGAFLAIPCCSYNLAGEKTRFKGTGVGVGGGGGGGGTGTSQYATLVSWTTRLTRKVGYIPEQEVLRIPSTRNIGIVGRYLKATSEEGDERETVEEIVQRIIEEEGGAEGWKERVVGLVGKGGKDGKGGH